MTSRQMAIESHYTRSEIESGIQYLNEAVRYGSYWIADNAPLAKQLLDALGIKPERKNGTEPKPASTIAP